MALSIKSYKETLSMVFDFEVHLRVRLCLHIASSKLGVVLEIFLLKELYNSSVNLWLIFSFRLKRERWV